MSTSERQHPLYISPTPKYELKTYNDYELDADAGTHYATPTATRSSASDSLLSNQDTVERGQARNSGTIPSQASLSSGHTYQDLDRTRPTPRGALLAQPQSYPPCRGRNMACLTTFFGPHSCKPVPARPPSPLPPLSFPSAAACALPCPFPAALLATASLKRLTIAV